MKFPLFLFFVILLTACSKNPGEPSDSENTGAVTLTGEIDAGTISRSVVIGNNFKYLWTNTTKPIALYFKQRTTNGSNQGRMAATLNIKNDGTCTFSVTLPAGITSWFVAGRDSVAGAIDTIAASTTVGQWQFRTPTAINAAGETYLPMFFPPTMVTAGTPNKVFATFQTLGSVLAIEVTNPRSVDYTPTNFYTRSSTFRTNGTVTWAVANRRTGNYPGWTAAPAGADTSVSITVSNMTVKANGGKDTLYVWVAQNGTTKARMVCNFRANANGSDKVAILRPAPANTLVDNNFYTVKMSAATELMITEVSQGSYGVLGSDGQGAFIELYNGGADVAQLSDYFMYGNGAGAYWQQLPAYSLKSGKLVVLALPPDVPPDAAWATERGWVTGDVLLLDNTAALNWYSPFYQGTYFILSKYTTDPNAYIDYADTKGTGDPGGGWTNAYRGMKRKTTILRPTPTFDYTQWTPYEPFNQANQGLGAR